ncbi:helix-turn-helix domain-containing protein [Streptomyces lasiicapitis]|uniref:helix-turn-helix domain-containing protein n=1 Tax=Streptomyces lasiicapitis TaxID=1923961 RepID=UPI00166409DA|nr:helix-turn-helix domain-containing protein [Streptomyces lasiicapitis]
MEPQEPQEYRYRAVREVLEVLPIGEVAARYGTSRQSLHSRRRRFEQEGMAGPRDRSRRPRTSPSRISAESRRWCAGSGGSIRAGALAGSASR